MKLIVMHYHLRTGGVTRVIENHLRAIEAHPEGPSQAYVLYGGDRSGVAEDFETKFTRMQVELVAVPELAYDPDGNRTPEMVLEGLLAVLKPREVGPENAILHIHNHALGKNAALTQVVPRLARAGWPLLLQPHDFAEDFRPEEYTRLVQRAGPAAQWYPQGPHVHYACLNHRDLSALVQAGFVKERVHFLPNPVLPAAHEGDREQGRRRLAEAYGSFDTYVLYPVRGISRKQLGELLLYAAAYGTPRRLFGLSLAPKNPVQVPQYEAWVQLAEQLKLPLRFATGMTADLSFEDHLAAADAFLTTSVAEGFGMAFLESCLLGRPLIGRNLPDITRDFVDAGIRFLGLRDALRIPVAWVGQDRWRGRFASRLEAVLSQYRLSLGSEVSVDDLVVRGLIDFAYLDPGLQAEVVTKVAQSPALADAFRELNPDPLSALETEDYALRVTESFGPSSMGTRMVERYRTVVGAEAGELSPPEKPDALLNAFLGTTVFRPCRLPEVPDVVTGVWSEVEAVITAHVRPLAPQPTDAVSRMADLNPRAVLFDIYGTLVISASGDISLVDDAHKASAMGASLNAMGFSVQDPVAATETFRGVIADHHQTMRHAGHRFPEVEIREVWVDTLNQLRASGQIAGPDLSEGEVEVLAADFEMRTNPVWPMPEAGRTLRALRDRGIVLGIVSNAQFYTKALFPTLLGASLSELGFDPELCFFSYAHRRGKPDPYKYVMAAEALARRGIPPEAVLYVGNDQRNDVWASSKAGFKTALFAGDARSLRLRHDHSEASKVTPDLVVTHLDALLSR